MGEGLKRARAAAKATRQEPDRKALFIDALAEFLVGDQAGKSIALEVEAKVSPIIRWASAWAKLRNATPLFGYPTLEEAKKTLTEWLR